jgi:aminoglycoside 6'-N-acetyltransferase
MEVTRISRINEAGFPVKTHGYSFRAVCRADLPFLHGWLTTAEVARWWGNPEAQFALLKDDFQNPLMRMRIVSFDCQPFAYAQDYDAHSWPQNHFRELPAGSRAIDSFIGEPDMIGRGHGSTFLRLLAQRLISEGAPLIAIDPDVSNVRARRAYAKAGFRETGIHQSNEGHVVLMLFL